MTNKEAKDILMRWIGCHKSDHKSCLNCYDCEDCEYNLNDKEVFDALDVAIEALEKQKTVDCDKCISEWCAICIHNKGLADCYMDLTNRLG